VSVKIPPIIFRKFKPSTKPPEDKRDAHFMLPGGREGLFGAARPVVTSWDQKPSTRYSRLLTSDERADSSPTQSPYLIHVKPELRGWGRGVSTIAEIEGALMPLKTKRPISVEEIDIPLAEVNAKQEGLDVEVTFVATRDVAEEEGEDPVPESLRFMPVPIVIRALGARTVNFPAIRALVSDPSTGENRLAVKDALLRIFDEENSRIVPNMQQWMNLGIPYDRDTEAAIQNLKESRWYQEFVGIRGRIKAGLGTVKLEQDGREVDAGTEIFIPYAFMVRLRQVYPKNAEYPHRVSADPTPNYLNKSGLDLDFIRRWGPEFYYLVREKKMRPEDAIMLLRRRQ
jgi:hypothetical protein